MCESSLPLVRYVAIVAVGEPDWVREQVDDGRRDFLKAYCLATEVTWLGRSGCILLHAKWGRDFVRSFQRDAEQQLARCLGRPSNWKEGDA